MVNAKSSEDKTPTRGSNFEKNQRPASSKRVTFALGVEGQEQADRIARILSVYKRRGVSQSAVVRGLLQFAETIALESGDPIAQPVMEASGSASSEKHNKIGKTKQESEKIWEYIRSVILNS